MVQMTVNNGDILKVVYEVTLYDGTIAQNVYYLIADLIAPQADLSVVNGIELWIEAMYAEVEHLVVDDTIQNICSVHEVEWNAVLALWEVTRFVGYFTPTINYSNVGEALPNQVSPFATFLTSRPKSRGRKFLYAWGETTQAFGYLGGPDLTALGLYADEVLDNVVLGPLNELIAGVVRTAVNEFLQFTGAVVTNVLGTQRRRRPGVGA
jgi:hypothetical protein